MRFRFFVAALMSTNLAFHVEKQEHEYALALVQEDTPLAYIDNSMFVESEE